MKIPLNKFEKVIDETILERGLAYFKGGAITDFSENLDGKYEAIVSGTEEYNVLLEIKNNTIVEHNCDCPYDRGPVCKHVVAVIFHVQKDESALNLPTPKNAKTKSKSVDQEVKKLLKLISQEELVEFVAKSSKKDKKFRNYFLASFGHLSPNQSKEFYQKQIHSILQTALGKDGWISWSNMEYVAKTTQPLLDTAEQYLKNQNFENVFFICTALLEEVTKAVHYGDDSDGYLGYFVDSAIELLEKVAKEKISESLKKTIFEYCISAFKNQIFEGWGWHLGALRIAGDLIDDETDVDLILGCLSAVKGNYESQSALSFKLELLRKYKTLKEVEEFVSKHISNPKIREEEIEKAIQDKNFNRASELAKDGIKCDGKSNHGLVKDWYDWLLKIALVQNDVPNIINYGRYGLIENFRTPHYYYQILKNNIEPEKWHPFVEEIIEEVAMKSKWNQWELVREIYIYEEWWDRLYLLLRQNLSLENIEKNEQYLSKDYSAELIELYGIGVMSYVEKFLGRNYYQTACRYLRRMKKLGGKKEVNKLIEQFRKKYPQRKALLDEISKV